MKNVLLFRHSKKEGTGNRSLSKEGIELARDIGQSRLQGRSFTDLYVSPLERTGATMNAFAEGAGDFPEVEHKILPAHLEVSERPDSMSLWSGVCHVAEDEGTDMLQAVLDLEPKLGHKIANLAAESFKKWLDELPEGSNVLVVGHSPFLELIALGLFDKQLVQLQPCDSFAVTLDDTGLHLDA